MLPPMSVAILDYDAGNLTSVRRACERLDARDVVVSHDPAVADAADAVIFPGVGAAGSCMDGLRRYGLDGAVRRAVDSGKPVLAICVGMQLLFERSEEDGGVPCLGILQGEVVRLRPADPKLKVPHMGWNEVAFRDEPLADGLDDTHCYFVHSYHCVPGPGVQVNATCGFGGDIVAGVRRANLVAFQFHPEKSGAVGARLLRNWLEAVGAAPVRA